ncbi:MAG: hypothetical protein FWD29_05515 [Micrococcales bacterium]|nr:hypothetical protein [Micrococcales bacterium]
MTSASIGIALVFSGVTPTASAAPPTPDPAAKVSDPATYQDYPAKYNTEEYLQQVTTPGRIWTDKSTFSDDIDTTHGHPVMDPTDTLPLGADELGVALSALGSTRHIIEEQPVPVDLVLVLDNSFSMNQCVDSSLNCNTAATYQNSRAYAMVQSVNLAIKTIMAANSANRVALVQFGTGAGLLLPLAAPTPINAAGDYVLFQPPTGTGTAMFLQFGPAAATNRLQIGGTTAQSTNMQAGFVTGMRVLTGQASSNVSGANQRYPNVIMFTDGEPTLSYSDSNWYNPTSTATQGPSAPPAAPNNVPFGNGFRAALAAALLKNQITAVYNNPTFNQANGLPQVDAAVYTVGLGIDALSPNGREVALATLDPVHQMTPGATGAAARFNTAWTSFAASPTGRAHVQVVGTATTGGTWVYLDQPTAPFAIYNPRQPNVPDVTLSAGMGYNDAYYSANTASDLIDAFNKIIQTITNSTPQYPTLIEGDQNATSSGFVTMTDQLGPFMQVSDPSSMLLTFCSNPESIPDLDNCDPVHFSTPSATTPSPGVTRYTFTGTYQANILAGPQNVAGIVIEVRRDASLATGDVVTFQVPAALLPINDSVVTLRSSASGVTPVSMQRYVSRPVHLFFKVAPKPGVADAIANPLSLNTASGAQPGDGTALAAYLAANTDTNGQVRFYSDDFTVTGSGVSRTVTPLSIAVFTPAMANPFYRFGTNTPLFADSNLTVPLTLADWNALPNAATVYYGNTVYYYDDPPTNSVVAVRTDALATTKAQLAAAEDATHQIAAVGGQMTAPAGLLNFARPGDLDAVKCLPGDSGWDTSGPTCADPTGAYGNLTDTATYARLTQFTSEVPTRLLGNNAFLAYNLPGQLAISKTVQAAPGLNPDPATPFTFTVNLREDNAAGAPIVGDFDYCIFDQTDLTLPVSCPGTIADGDSLTITAEQTAIIYGLPDSTYWSVSEQAPLPPGFTNTQPAGGTTSGTITAPDTSTASFVNTYAAAPVDIAANASKTLTGRPWAAGDVFQARMCPYPLPGTGSAVQCDVETFQQIGTTNQGTVTFPSLTFDTPGVYTFTISEVIDNPTPGISHSAAVFQWTVTVTDNGSGQLVATEQWTQTVDHNGLPITPPALVTEAEFENTYDPNAISEPLTATKMISDNSLAGGNLRTPTSSFDFTFSYLGADLQSGGNPAVPPPLFYPSDPGPVTVASAGSAIHSPAVIYTPDHIGHSLFFNAVESGSGVPPNVTVSDAVWFWQVAVATDPGSGDITLAVTNCVTTQAAITPAAPFGSCDPTAAGAWAATSEDDRLFVNTYSPDDVDAFLEAVKTLQGRPWTTADSFSFTLTANDQATTDALTSGDIAFDTSSATCPGVTVTGQEATVTVDSTAQTSNQAPFCFALTLSQQGAYQFALTETGRTGPTNGMTYDTHTAIFDVVVTGGTTAGQLQADVTLRNSQNATAQFVNRYQATHSFAGLNLWKDLTGRDLAIGEFSFTLTGLDQAACDKASLPSPPPCTVPFTNANGTGDPIYTHLPAQFSFTQDDLGETFTYTVVESTTPALGGVTHDTTTFTVTLTPQFDPATGTIYVLTDVTSSAGGTVSYDSRTDPTPLLTFANTYLAAAVQARPTFTKTLSGRAWTQQDEFSFTITALTLGAPMPALTDITVGYADQSGNTAPFDFGDITFSSTGVFQYAVAEVTPSPLPGGMVIDQTPSIVTITVTDDGQGNLVAAIDYDGIAFPINRDFVNFYQPTAATVSLLFTKTLTGRAWTSADSFEFRITAVTQTAPLPPASSVTVTRANRNSFGFGPIVITQAGVFRYSVMETRPSTVTNGVSPDPNPRTAVVTVVDDGQGNLVASVTYPNGQAFINTYSLVPVPSPPTPPFGPPLVATGGQLVGQGLPFALAVGLLLMAVAIRLVRRQLRA